MSPTETTLLGFIAWTVLLLMTLGGFRTSQVLARKRAPNAFSATGDDIEGFGKRLTRAHANCYENLPIVGALLLYAIATGQTAVTDGLAYVFLAFRIGQSVVHLISTSNTFVRLRFYLFLPQVAIVIFWLLRFFHIL